MKRVTAVITALFLILNGCETIQIGGFEHAEILQTGIREVSKAIRPISDEEEYFVGRSVAVQILSSFPLFEERRLTEYLNFVGQTVAMHSDKPVTYGGYHFALLDSGDINAFASPGGTIFITRGMLHAVRSEDELAAVLAHEVAHINHRDGISSIKKARWTEAVTTIGAEATQQYGSEQLAKLVQIFEGSIDDIVKTLVVKGYGRKQELAADAAAVAYLVRAGYDHEALYNFVERLIKAGKGSKGGVLKTHPATTERLENIRENMPSKVADKNLAVGRVARFKSFIY